MKRWRCTFRAVLARSLSNGSNSLALRPVCSGEGSSALETVTRAQDGDVAAFEQLVLEYTPIVYRIASAIVGEQTAGEVAQETFVSAWRHINKLKDPDRFAAWLYRIVVNQSRTVLRSRRLIRDVPLEIAAFEADADFRPRADARLVLAPALRRLSHDQRAVIALHYAAAMSIAEVATVLDVPAGTVKSRLNVALAALRRSLSEV
jgi:RNA polymerase sigma-70 factor (ECF subfamily)